MLAAARPLLRRAARARAACACAHHQHPQALAIDVHTHFIPPDLPDFGAKYGYYDGFVHLKHTSCGADMYVGEQFFRAVERNCYEPAARLEDMARDSVDVQVLSIVPVYFGYWMTNHAHAADFCATINDALAETVHARPDRFVGLGQLPLQAPEAAVAELERCVLELGMRGVQVGSHVNDWHLGAPELRPVWERAAELGAAVFVHPWDMMGGQPAAQYWASWLVSMPAETTLAIQALMFSGVLERLPHLRVLFAHAGGSFPGTWARLQKGWDCRPDLLQTDSTLAPREYLRDPAAGREQARFWVDSLTHNADALRHVVELFGASRVALGSDFPFPLGEVPGAGKLIRSVEEFTPQERDLLLAGSALEWLGMSREDFA